MRKHGQGDQHQQGNRVDDIIFAGSPEMLNHTAEITISSPLKKWTEPSSVQPSVFYMHVYVFCQVWFLVHVDAIGACLHNICNTLSAIYFLNFTLIIYC